MKGKAITKQQLLLEMEKLQTKLIATVRRLQEADELAQDQISERRRAEETFERVQKYAESIVETIREPLLVLTPDLRVITANPSFYKTFHGAPKKTEGQFVYSIGDHAWDIPSLRLLLEEIIPQNTGFNDFEVDHEFPVIGRRSMLLNARRIYREGQGTDMILLAFEDITEQKQSEEALQVSETRYRRLFETAQDGILILDAETGRISDVNPFLVEMLGYSYEEFLGKQLWEIGPFQNIEAAKAVFLQLQGKGYVRYKDLPLETKKGRSIAVEFVSNVYRVNDRKVIQCNIRDITEQKHIADALQQAHNELERRVEERTVELRTALSEIKTMKDQLEAENIYFRQEIKMKHQFDHILGQSDGLKYVLYRAEQVAPTNTTVLILGETGTGKELIAAAIHNLSPRKDRSLITVNCAALPANLIESELFGREKGAFTGADTRQVGRFEVAHGSTLCLDEIGELPLEVQAKLLRAIQHNEFERLGSSHTIKVDARIVATTNRNLEEEVRKGRFRQDLYYRLNVFPITVPPLRQRKEDIPLLVQAFIERYARKLGKQITSIPKETMKALQDYPWPGNVRELESVLERAVILCPGPVLQLADKLEISSLPLSSGMKTLEEMERDQILKTLLETRWRIEGKDGAAAILGLHPSTLRARMHKLGILRPEIKESD
jgi:formate hydrogenlyase transcriptional activator